MPNHPRFPVLLYRGVRGARTGAASALEALFARNGWPPQWRDGIYAFHHYHTRGHEALGVAAGGGAGAARRAGRARGDARDRDVACSRRGPGPAGVTGYELLVVGAFRPGSADRLRRR